MESALLLDMVDTEVYLLVETTEFPVMGALSRIIWTPSPNKPLKQSEFQSLNAPQEQTHCGLRIAHA